MSFGTVVVIIVAILGLVSVIRGRSGAALGFAPDEDGNQSAAPQREVELRAEIEMLRERLEVLERITTDANSTEARARKQLEAEIEDLRERN